MIQFHFQDIAPPTFFDEEKLTSWLLEIAKKHGAEIVGLNYFFLSDEGLLEINKTHLNHDYYTDIITFPYKEGKELESDILISLDRVKDNAQTFEATYQHELLRVMAHGVLHLIGFNDKNEAEQQSMREAEDDCVEMYFS